MPRHPTSVEGDGGRPLPTPQEEPPGDGIEARIAALRRERESKKKDDEEASSSKDADDDRGICRR